MCFGDQAAWVEVPLFYYYFWAVLEIVWFEKLDTPIVVTTGISL